MGWNKESFREKLESEHTFPGVYMFKFIVPLPQQEEVLKILPAGKVTTKKSSNNNYVSVTLKAHVESSQVVIDTYTRAYEIQGIVAL